VNGNLNKDKIIEKYSIPRADKYILIAPTWQQDVQGRSVLPFELNADEFFTDLDALAKKHSAHIIFRTHLNSADDIDVSHLTSTSFMPYSKYEVVEDFLFIADILVTDWSSIGIDHLPLRRPTIFLDVPAPFKYGFNLGPEHRYGDVVADFSSFKSALGRDLSQPEAFLKQHGQDIETSIISAYGPTLDGNSSRRYFENLQRLIQE
jgi:CDP-glycerol glycerophosphotransferase